MSAYFITGTDTDVGKTLIASALLRHFNRQGCATTGFKPIAAGCEQTPGGLRNSDALSLMQHSSIKAAYGVVNPFAFAPPIAPHIAAQAVNQPLSVASLATAYRQIRALNADITIVEGAGGWCLPLNDKEYLYHWVAREQFEVILVVGLKLGCLNHALLTQAFIQAQGLKIAGWVANLIDPDMRHINDNIATLKHHLDAPLLASVPYLTGKNPEQSAIVFELSGRYQ